MSMLITHGSALERLRAVPPVADTSFAPHQDVIVAELGLEALRIGRLAASIPGLPGLPLNLLIADAKSFRASPSVRVHTTRLSSIPAPLLCRLGPQVYVAGPELTFIQMAKTLSLVGSIVLGYELCGGYSHFYKRASGYYERPPLTTIMRINAAMETLGAIHGAGRAKEALRHVQEGSASPMETVMACMLSLPRKMGGFGCRGIELNREVSLDKVARGMTGTKTCRVDAAFPRQLIGFEYDSLTHHVDPIADRRRREALSHLGWTIYTVDLDSITRFGMLKDIVRLLEGTVMEVGELEMNDDGRSCELLARLLKATRYRMGINDLLFSVEVPAGRVRVHI